MGVWNRAGICNVVRDPTLVAFYFYRFGSPVKFNLKFIFVEALSLILFKVFIKIKPSTTSLSAVINLIFPISIAH